jgi:mRNA-degrading endonuclease YafQ of YafQ-DinJ toxin-antitoxin module
MNAGSGRLIYDESDKFADKIKYIQKKDPETFRRIKAVINRLLVTPTIYDHPLQGEKKCKFVKYVGKNLARIVYNWCENCRRSNSVEVNQCADCTSKPDNTLRLFDVYYKNEANKLGY